MAKKNTPGTTPSTPSAAPARRRTPARRAAATPAAAASLTGAGLTDIATVSTAAELNAVLAAPQQQTSTPSFHDIAIAAYLRYLQRGRQDGRDFDDWLEAETELKRLTNR